MPLNLTFVVIVTKCLCKAMQGQDGLLDSLRGCSILWCRRLGALQSLTSSPGEQAAQRRQEVGLDSITSRPTFPSYALAPVRQGSTTFQRSDARWGPSVQVCEPIGKDVHFPVYSGNLKDSQLTCVVWFPFLLGASLISLPASSMEL